MPSPRNTPRTGVLLDLDDGATPILDAPDRPRGSGLRQRLIGWYALAAIVLAPLLLVGLIVGRPDRSATAASTVSTVSDRGRAAAEQIVSAWISGTPSPVPGAPSSDVPSPITGVAWAGVSTRAITVDEAVVTLETHRFEAILAGARVQLEVVVLIDAAGAISGWGDLTLTPIPAATRLTIDNAWPAEWSPAPLPDAAARAVDAWAVAYAGGDPDALTLLVRDPDPAHAYQPLVGVSGGAVTVIDSARKNGDRMIASVQLDIDAGAGPVTIGLDLLIADPDTTPAVVAWGAAGSGHLLEPWSNAVGETTDARPVATTTTTTIPVETTVETVPPTTIAPAPVETVPVTAPPATWGPDICPAGDLSGNPQDDSCDPPAPAPGV